MAIEELKGYIWLSSLPSNTKVFTFGDNYEKIIGFDKYICEWCKEEKKLKDGGFEQPLDQIYHILKERGYSYLVIDSSDTRKSGVNETNNFVQSLNENNKFKLEYSTKSVLAFKLI